MPTALAQSRPLIHRTAAISSDGHYRYHLGRSWGAEPGRTMVVIGLNPSTADADSDDATGDHR